MWRTGLQRDDSSHDAQAQRGVAPGKVSQSELIYRKAAGGGEASAVDADAAVASTSGSQGAPLPEAARSRFESSLDTDLSSVRVHTGSSSATAAEGLGARAFAVGQDIHFGAGQYAPDDPFGMHLLAHEVAHTVQQHGGGPRAKLAVSQPGDAVEAEADRAADAMVSGGRISIGGGRGPRVARQAAPGAEQVPAEGQPAAAPAADPAREQANAAATAYGTKLASEPGARIPAVENKDQIRNAQFQANDEHKGEESGDAALTGWVFLRDPFDNTVTARRPDGTGLQLTFQVSKAEEEGGAPQVSLVRTLELSALRVGALKRQDKMAPIELQEGPDGPANRRAQDKQNAIDARAKYRKEHPGVVEAWEAKVEEWKKAGSKGTPPPPPAGYRVTDLKTTLCTNTPSTVYQAGGGDARDGFPFTPPTDWPTFRTLDKHPEGPSPGDVYYLWDIGLNRAAHMGVFKSATPLSGQDDVWMWTVTDGGQGDYDKIQQAQERGRGPFFKKTGLFKSSIAEAGQSPGDRRLVGWVDIDAFRAEKEAKRAPPALPATP